MHYAETDYRPRLLRRPRHLLLRPPAGGAGVRGPYGPRQYRRRRPRRARRPPPPGLAPPPPPRAVSPSTTRGLWATPWGGACTHDTGAGPPAELITPPSETM